MSTKVKFNIVIGALLFISLLGNIAFVCTSLHHARQAGQSSARIESELSSATSSVSSATGTIKQVSTGLDSVATELRDSQSTAGAIKDNAESSIKGCGDIEQTIKELRAQIEVLENDCNNSSSSSSGSDSNVDNH